jgi:hypothetical protein
MHNYLATDFSRHAYDKDNDQHVRAIDRLVHELGMPAEDVNSVYREVLAELKKDAGVKAFLPVLASLGVQERLRQS